MPEYPTLLQRYLSTVVDGCVMVFCLVVAAVSYQGRDPAVHAARVLVFLAILLSYEPILTSKLCTVGQAVLGVRVRRRDDLARRISLPRAYLRTVVKGLLGIYSFFSMGFDPARRALHDHAAGSVVITARSRPSSVARPDRRAGGTTREGA